MASILVHYELLLKERKMTDNFICYGVWIGEKKPVMWRFLKPLTEEISQLENGLELADNMYFSFQKQVNKLICKNDN